MEDKYDWEEWDPSSLSFRQHMVAGCIAGVSEHIVFFPIDTLRVMAIGFDCNERRLTSKLSQTQLPSL